MTIRSLLIANRGEIAIRIARTASDLGITAIAVHAQDDGASLHNRLCDRALALPGRGAAAYLDGQALVSAALEAGCDAIHPGYGFLSENADFAARCADAGLRFVGPSPQALALFGDKRAARGFARSQGVPVLRGTDDAVSLEEALAFRDSLGPEGAVMVKALHGGGGRGMRAVGPGDDLAEAFDRCAGEAQAAFGRPDLYVEELILRARHIEVQILGDGTGAVSHLWDRDCTVQRRHQKILEIAPAPALPDGLRAHMLHAARELGAAAAYRGAGTMEFLVWTDETGAHRFAFIEANARLQVEHTVTEAVTGLDIVAAQIRLAEGATLADLGLDQERVPDPRGVAIQARVNTESLGADGSVRPSGGVIRVYEPPSGPAIRVDGTGYGGYETHPGFDTLLAKIITHGPDLKSSLARLDRALKECRIEGVATTIPLLRAVLARPELACETGALDVDTRFVDRHAGALVAAAEALAPLPFADTPTTAPQAGPGSETGDHKGPAGTVPVSSPMQGTIVAWQVTEGDAVARGQTLCVLEAMKMEHVISAPRSGFIRVLSRAAGDTVYEAAPLAYLEPAEVAGSVDADQARPDPDHIRADLQHVLERHAYGLDENRPEAVAKRRKLNMRTARENVTDLCDAGTFIEYGALAIAAQRKRRTVQDLMERTPADGLIGGMGRVNGAQFGDEAARTMVLAYDYTVLAGTQGTFNHKKTDRLLHIAEDLRLPIVFFTEGGGGRPGDTDSNTVAGLDVPTFRTYGRLSGVAPRIAVNNGRCFAGNAALFGCADIGIATWNSNIGMGGPAMIEGGGLGVFKPEDVGPMDVQTANGVVDIAVEDEEQATAMARRVLSYFQGNLPAWDCADQRELRHVIPENRLRVYDIRDVIRGLCDTGSVVELREHFAPGMITALVRLEGKPFGLLANNPRHLSGAIDSDGADKASRFLQLCDAFDLPVISLCDTPGIMVGPDAEKTALVRHAARMFVTAGSLTVPIFAVVLRKGYGLGAQTMTGGSFHGSVFTAAWPSGEFGGMGLEGAVRLGYRKELEEAGSAEEQQALFDKLVARSYEVGRATNMAAYLEIDAVIDPKDTRSWILNAHACVPPPQPRTGKKRPMIDTW